jgi:hypothetical protein
VFGSRWRAYNIVIFVRSIPVRKVLGDLKEKSPLGMMQGCQWKVDPIIRPRRTY